MFPLNLYFVYLHYNNPLCVKKLLLMFSINYFPQWTRRIILNIKLTKLDASIYIFKYFFSKMLFFFVSTPFLSHIFACLFLRQSINNWTNWYCFKSFLKHIIKFKSSVLFYLLYIKIKSAEYYNVLTHYLHKMLFYVLYFNILCNYVLFYKYVIKSEHWEIVSLNEKNTHITHR